MATDPNPKRRQRRIINYPARLHVMISEEAAANIERLAEKADWPSSEVVRQAGRLIGRWRLSW